MFKRKYTVTILDSQWNVLVRNTKIVLIPRKDELIFLNNEYFEVLNIIHMVNQHQDIFIIVQKSDYQALVKST